MNRYIRFGISQYQGMIQSRIILLPVVYQSEPTKLIMIGRVVRPIQFRKYNATSRSYSMNSFWQWTTTARPSWKENKTEAAVAIVVFGITGSLSVLAVRPSLKSIFGIEGTLIDGPNSYRVLSILCVSPMYAAVLLAIGTLSGRHNYFAKMSMKILGRFVPKTVIHRVMCKPAKSKIDLPK